MTMERGYRRGRAWGRLLGLLAGLMVVGTMAAHAGPVVERISFAPRADGQGYVVRIHTPERVQAYSEPRFVAAHHLELILFNADLAAAARRDAPEGPVRAYSIAPRKGHLVLQLELDAGVQVEPSAYRDRRTNDLILGLAYTDAVLPAPTPAVPVRHASTSAQPPARTRSKSADPPLDDARARWRLDTIVIDAGHGGHDTGAIGAGGLREKDVVLPVARRVGQYLEERLGVRVVYTRSSDHFVTLRERGKIANREGGKLFISIHANAARNRSATGAETYFLGLHKTDAARHVMERENSVVRYESNPDAYDHLDERALIEQTLTQSAYLRKSEQLADQVQRQFAERVHRKDRGVKQAGFYVLWGASMPAVLVELGFVTNPDEAAFLKSERGQDYLASAIFRAVRDFKAQYEKGL